MTREHIYTPSAAEQLSETIVFAVAETKGVDPLELNERLYDCINPDALDRLFAPVKGDSVGSVVFRMAGCRVTVESGRTVVVRDEESSRVEAFV